MFLKKAIGARKILVLGDLLIRRRFLLTAMFLLAALAAQAQTGAFTYQGRLTDNAPQGGTYLLKFELFDAASDGALIDVLTDVPATVANNVFTVELNFTAANAFDGGERFLQISVRRSVSESYVTLAPRQKISAAPYAVRALTAANALQLDGTPASQLVREGDTRLTDARQPLAGSGDYIQNQNVTPQAATDFNISGTGAANIFNATTQFNIGGTRVLGVAGNGNLYAGINAGGGSNNEGQLNSFFGSDAGYSNTTGLSNSYFGADSGLDNTTGSNNSFFGVTAGRFNTTGSFNSAFGRGAGQNNTTGANNSSFGSLAGLNTTTGGDNSFFGNRAGTVNKTGSNNSALGSFANVASENLNFATAIGAGALVSNSNTIVLGRSGGEDTVQIPGALSVTGNLNVAGVFGANILNAATQFNLGGSRVLFTTPVAGKTFVGVNAGLSNVNGAYISFFGEAAGRDNTDGTHSAYFGSYAGSRNTTGSYNSFLGADAGFSNVTGEANTYVGFRSGWAGTGSENTFVGSDAGWETTTGIRNVSLGRSAGGINKTGSNNTFIGYKAQPTLDNLNFATAIGANATVSTSNTIVLGRSDGSDTVQVPGTLNAARFYLNNQRILAAGSENIFLGFNTAPNNTSGNANSFFGNSAGTGNTTGTFNSFFGYASGNVNTSGGDNSFFGKNAGINNTTGSRNTFVGTITGYSNTNGSDNTALGFNANVANNVSFATAVGSNATVSTSNTIVLGRSGGEDAVQIPGRVQVGGGDVYVDNPGAGVIMRAPNGNCFRLTVANNGALATASVVCPQ